MSGCVLLAVLAAALMHATWNALIKSGASKVASMFILTFVQGMIGLAIALTRPFPEADVWPWLFASGLFHAGYKVFLSFAYEKGDLSRVYPIARGAAPMIVTLISAAFMIDAMSGFEYLGILVLGLGIALMARGVFTNKEDRRLVPLALGSACMTAGYSLVDGMGARVSGDAVMYVAWLFIFDITLFTPVIFLLRGTEGFRASAKDWRMGGLAATASYGAYAIAVWAMTVAPIALVTALRETSILFAVLIGWLIMGDRMDRGKAAAAIIILLGVVLTRL